MFLKFIFRENLSKKHANLFSNKVNGKKLYEYARNGEEVEIKERDIEIMMIELIDFSNNEIVFDVKCSKGNLYSFFMC